MTAVCEGYSSENIALRVECEAQEAEIAQLKNFLQQSVARPDLYPGPQRVTLNKALNVFPEKAWQQLNNDVPHVDDSDVIRALEEQLKDKNEQLSLCFQEITQLKNDLKNNSPPGTVIHEENTAHLLSQINFLHNEVERLEQQVATVRENAVEEVQAIAVEYKEKLLLKEKENRSIVEQLRGRKNRSIDGEDFVSRCKMLESQLALALSEKNSLLIEKNDLSTKIRKLDTALKERKHEALEAQRMASHESVTSGSQIKSLQEVIQVLSDERTSLQKQLHQFRSEKNIEHVHNETQTENALVCTLTQTETVCMSEKECQVDLITYSGDIGAQSVQSLTHLLEIKCAEYDDLRAQMDDLSSIHRDTLSTLERTKKRLVEEVERRKLLSDDAEKLSLQVRSLQQKCSQQAAAERELYAKVSSVEEQKQLLRMSSVNIEREKHGLEEQLQQYQKDMDQLIANKNYCNQQVAQLSSENEKLQAEIQRLHQHEAQLAYSLKAKDGELREILSAYQNAVKEVELQTDSQRTIERELEATRATLASKEQGIIYLQEQLNQLHHRDQQLSLDLQTFEYENSQLHRKIVQTEALVAQLESNCNELQQVSLAKDRATEELQQSLAELSKQIVLKENECMLLRQRCESLQRDVSRLQSAHELESRRLHELEDINARLVVRGVMSSEDDDRVNVLREEVKVLKESLQEKNFSLQTLQEQLQREQDERKKCTRELQVAQTSLEEALDSKERLQQVVLDQAATLSHLSQ
ncbi:BRCT domain-containing protein [Trypanosoma theileri]|uniref:BRCT domain-containing protein n=1 Tax=Trypanosoma theileri TaxID=67003 RepID=A0A1X0NJR6_9TRYP|nr:BRCT domain-containing protein [Trypanosoma theileri]ORC84350.1 BRCT domain-containing protein [Trypanosoma theileri]